MKYFNTYKDYLNEQVVNESNDEQDVLKDLKGEDRPRLHQFKNGIKADINVYEPKEKEDEGNIDMYLVFNPETKHFVTIKAFNDYFKNVEAGEITEAVDKKTVKKITVPLKKVKAAITNLKSEIKDKKPAGNKPSDKGDKPTTPPIGSDSLDAKTIKPTNKELFTKLKSNIDILSNPKSNDAAKQKAINNLLKDGLISANSEGGGANKIYINTKALGLDKGSDKLLSGGKSINPKANHIVNTIINTADAAGIELPGRRGVGKKTHTPAKISERAAKRLGPPATANKEIAITKKEGSVKIGDTEYKSVKVPDEATKKKLLVSYKERGIKDPEAEYSLYLKSIKKQNDFIKNADKYFGGKNPPVINWYEVGSKPPKSISQKDDAGKAKMKEAILFEIADSLKSADKATSDKLLKLSKSAGKLKKEEFDKQLEETFAALIDSKDTRAGAPDMAEMITALQKLNDGYEVYIPSASNFKLGDVIAIKNVDSLTTKTSAKDMATASQAIYSSLDLASVKYELGGASSSGGKIENTTYSDAAAGKALNDILSMYDKLWKDSNATASSISSVKSQINSYITKFKLNDKKIKEEAKKKAEASIKTSTKAWTEQKLDSKKQNLLKLKWDAYCLAGVVMEKMYNKYTDIQNFGNVSYRPKTKAGKTGSIETSETNGVTSLCRLQFDHSQVSKNGTPNNTFPTRMHNMPRELFDKLRLVDKIKESEDGGYVADDNITESLKATKYSSYSDFLNENNSNL